MDAEVEQRDLADAGAGAHGDAQAVGETAPVLLGEDLGLSDKHVGRTIMPARAENTLRTNGEENSRLALQWRPKKTVREY